MIIFFFVGIRKRVFTGLWRFAARHVGKTGAERNIRVHCGNKSKFERTLISESAIEDKFDPDSFHRLLNLTTSFSNIHNFWYSDKKIN